MQTTLITAFLGGILSIFSPCILPLLPAYFAYLSGTTLNGTTTNNTTDTQQKTRTQKTTSLKTTTKPTTNKTHSYLLHAILFSVGFSVIFIFFGASIGALGKFLLTNKRIIEIIGGIIIIFFAIQISGLTNKFFKKEFHTHLSQKSNRKLEKFKYLRSLITGVIFAFGWSPCYGPILGSILTLSIVETSFSKGITLFTVYSLGMTVSLILVAILASKVSNLGKKTKYITKTLQIIFAIMLLYLGITMLTGNISFLANTINTLYIKYNINFF